MTQATVSAEQAGQMTHREVLEALSGLLLAMFVAMLSSTVVTNALPRIVTDLDGSQTGYTWVVVATLLTMTATTPIWGKLADLFSKKLLVQSALVIYSAGSLIAGLAPSMEVLIGARAAPGPRRRRPDRAGPGRDRLDGQPPRTRPVLRLHRRDLRPGDRERPADRRASSWTRPASAGDGASSSVSRSRCSRSSSCRRPCTCPSSRREVHVDYLGATLLVAGVSILLVWVSLAGHASSRGPRATSAALVVVGLLVVAAAIYVEARVADRAGDPAAAVPRPHHQPWPRWPRC